MKKINLILLMAVIFFNPSYAAPKNSAQQSNATSYVFPALAAVGLLMWHQGNEDLDRFKELKNKHEYYKRNKPRIKEFLRNEDSMNEALKVMPISRLGSVPIDPARLDIGAGVISDRAMVRSNVRIMPAAQAHMRRFANLCKNDSGGIFNDGAAAANLYGDEYHGPIVKFSKQGTAYAWNNHRPAIDCRYEFSSDSADQPLCGDCHDNRLIALMNFRTISENIRSIEASGSTLKQTFNCKLGAKSIKRKEKQIIALRNVGIAMTFAGGIAWAATKAWPKQK